MGPLINRFGPSGPSQLGIPLTATVSDSCTVSGWMLRPARSQEAETLQIHLCSVPLPSLTQVPDSFVWEIGDQSLPSYTAKQTWESIRNRGTPQPWAEVFGLKASF